MSICNYDEATIEVDLLELLSKQQLGGVMNHRILELKVSLISGHIAYLIMIENITLHMSIRMEFLEYWTFKGIKGSSGLDRNKTGGGTYFKSKTAFCYTTQTLK